MAISSRVLHSTQANPPASRRIPRSRDFLCHDLLRKQTNYFQDPSRCKVAIEALKRTSQEAQFSVHAYCLMPDHVHFLLEGTGPGSNLVKFVSQWKQQTGYLFRNDLPKGFWQRRFYDHILRSGDHSESVGWYIWMNPVRKEIVLEPHRYPFSGSLTLDWPKVSAPAKVWSPPWKSSVRPLGNGVHRPL